MENHSNKALVLGGGLAGMSAALTLAARGHKVVLADSAPAVGGLFPLLDNQFPTQSCGVCFMNCATPTYCPFIQSELHENVELLPNATLTDVSGAAGDFTLAFSVAPSSVNSDKCTDCGACEAVCPVEVTREFGDGLETRRAIYRAYPKSVGKGYVVDRAACTRCGECVKACASNAVELDMPSSGRTEKVAAVILAPGGRTVNAGIKGEYGFGRYANVLSGVKFERMLAAGSPSSGKPVRPSDGKTPESIAFIQCVGSRDPANGRTHCSSVCCMFTLKQALFAKERAPTAKITVYYMDLRAFGKDYERYIREAEKAGIEFVRAMPSLLRLDPRTQDIVVSVYGPKGLAETPHSLAVLANGFECSPETAAAAGLFGLTTDVAGLILSDEFAPCATPVPGVFAAGVFRGPKDIPEATAEGAAAAGLAAVLLEKPSADSADLYRTPADFRDEEPKVGVVLCRCDGYTEKLIDFNELTEKASKLGEVAFVETIDHACSKAGMAECRRIFGEREPNRLILASCTERIVGDLYSYMFREMGVHPSVVSVADLRGAARGKDLSGAVADVAAAVSAANATTFSSPKRVSAQDNVLVVGGGAAGLASALALAELGHTVHLLEKTNELGGNLRSAFKTVDGGDLKSWLAAAVARVKDNPLIQVHLRSQAVESKGRVGQFATRVENPEGSVEIIHGAAVLATGAAEAKPKAYGYGQSPRVVTQREFEAKLAAGEMGGGTIVMVQCVGSREEAEGCRPWCSRVCCTHAIKNARAVKAAHPEADVRVLYRDLRAYGRFEQAYEAARREGVAFTAFNLSSRPEAAPSGEKVRVTWAEPSFGSKASVEADWLVLSTGMAPDAEEAAKTAAVFGVETDAGGFYVEKNPKAATTDFARPGIYLAGLAHAPKHAAEAMTQAKAAAARISALLAAKTLEAVANPSNVSANICSRCGVCVEACPYGARTLDFELNQAVVDEIVCKACGACVTACPNKAARQHGASPAQLYGMIDELL